MPRFAYTARDRAGQPVSATLEAPSRKDALRVIAARGQQVLRVSEESATGKSGQAPTRSPLLRPATRPSRNLRLPFLQALHDLTTSGLSAGEAVRLLAQRIKDPALRGLCGNIWEHISEGAPLSRAMAANPEVFDDATLNLIAAGEVTGSLNDTLARLIAHLIEQKEVRRQIISALAYPIFMMTVASGVILFFLFFLLPRMQSLFTSLGGELPTSTRLLIALSQFTIDYGLFIAVAVSFSLAAFWRWRQSEAGRNVTDAAMLRLPLIAPFATAQTVLAFSQTLSVLLANGITTAEALRMTERQIHNRVHRDAFDRATDRVLEGETLSIALARTGCFPDLVLDQLSVGENTGNIVPALRKIATSYQQKLSQQLSLFTRVIASGVLLSVFIFIGFLAYAIVDAVFELSSSFNL
ncbi:type II secretion system F family protein [Opitutaceae bacterium]